MDDAFEVPADWYDGTNALRHSGVLRWDGRGGLSLQASSSRVDLNAADLRFGETRTDRTLYRSESVPIFAYFCQTTCRRASPRSFRGRANTGRG